MHEAVDAVDGRGHPGDEQGDEEQRGDLGVAEGGAVGFERGARAVVAARRGAGGGGFVREGWARRGDGDSVALVVSFGGEGAATVVAVAAAGKGCRGAFSEGGADCGVGRLLLLLLLLLL